MKFGIRRCVKCFIPLVVFFTYNLLRGLYGKYCMRGETGVNQLRDNLKSDNLFILGNGPSLKKTLENHLDFLRGNECVVVNKFGNTDYFFQIKPRWYVLVDPAFFMDFNMLPVSIKTEIVSLCNQIKDKVTWNLCFCLPITAKKSEFVRKIKFNSNITVCYFNTYGTSSIIPDCSFKYKLWDFNFLAPLAQTVLNTTLQIGILLRYKEIYLLGADTSWHANYELDQETNILYSVDTHFYGIRKIPLYIDVEQKYPSKLHEELKMVSCALEGYWTLEYYAKYAGVKIYNASEFSWIDAFERRKIKDLIL